MARNLEQVLAKLPAKRRAKVERRAAELATLKDLRHAVERTQEELAIAPVCDRTRFLAWSSEATCCFQPSSAMSKRWEARSTSSPSFPIVRR